MGIKENVKIFFNKCVEANLLSPESYISIKEFINKMPQKKLQAVAQKAKAVGKPIFSQKGGLKKTHRRKMKNRKRSYKRSKKQRGGDLELLWVIGAVCIFIIYTWVMDDPRPQRRQHPPQRQRQRRPSRGSRRGAWGDAARRHLGTIPLHGPDLDEVRLRWPPRDHDDYVHLRTPYWENE